MRKISLLALLFTSVMSFGQEDSTTASTLLYFEPIHSDRPGFTYDAKHLSQGVLIQSGGFTLINGNYTVLGGNTKVRYGTSIGEFDLDGALQTESSVGSYTSNNINRSSGYTSRNKSLSASYRYSLPLFENKLRIGAIIGGSIGNLSSQTVSNAVSVSNDTLKTFSYNSFLSDYYGVFGYINIHGQLSEHWRIGTSIGMRTFKAPDTDLSYWTTATLNISYTYKRLTIFVEPMWLAPDEVTGSLQYQGGFSYNLSRDFSIDAFMSVDESIGSFNNSLFAFGFTYFLR